MKVEHKLKTRKLDHKLFAVRSPDFAAVAKGFGCAGRTAKTTADIESAEAQRDCLRTAAGAH